MNFEEYCMAVGLKKNIHLIVHSSFRSIKKTFGETKASDIVSSLQNIVTTNGSIIMPSFVYCWKKKDGSHSIFDRENSPGKVGYLAEVFRKTRGVIRTSSPTHSFSMWGKVTEFFDAANSPESPLGKGSVLEWLSQVKAAFVLMLGTDFNSFTFGHYLEICAPVPWSDFSPWGYLGVEYCGVSVYGEQKLKEIPGCSKAFVNFEKYLIKKNIISPLKFDDLQTYFLPVEIIYRHGLNYFAINYKNLLCPKNTCKACDSRREVYLNG